MSEERKMFHKIRLIFKVINYTLNVSNLKRSNRTTKTKKTVNNFCPLKLHGCSHSKKPQTNKMKYSERHSKFFTIQTLEKLILIPI